MAGNSNNRTWGIVIIILHWLTAVSVVGLFILGLWMTSLNYYSQWYKIAPNLHKSVGITLFILTLFRVIWRLAIKRPECLPSHSRVERALASIVHVVIYLLLFMVMLSGYLISTSDGRSIEVFGLFSIPSFPYYFLQQEDIAGVIHLYLAFLLIIITALHAFAAIKHHVIDKDSTLKRMISWR